MQIGTLRLLRTWLACLFFLSILVLALILKFWSMIVGTNVGDGTGLAVTSVVAIASFIGWMVAAIALARRNRGDST